MIEFSKVFMKSVIDKELSLIDVLERLGVVDKGELSIDRTCFCPFHENHETKAAKIYLDDAGVTLFCFSEQKSYRSSDAFERFSKYRIEKIFSRVWDKLSEDKKVFYLSNLDSGGEVSLSEWKDTVSELDKFKENKISYKEFLDIILKKIGN